MPLKLHDDGGPTAEDVEPVKLAGWEIVEPGSRVRIAGDIEATVCRVSIAPGPHVTYEVAWWNGRTRQCQWLETHELTNLFRTRQIGFLTPAG